MTPETLIWIVVGVDGLFILSHIVFRGKNKAAFNQAKWEAYERQTGRPHPDRLRAQQPSEVHGSARFMAAFEADQEGVGFKADEFPRTACQAGIMASAGADGSRQLRYLGINDENHLITIAPTRTGKTSSHVIPNLLMCEVPMFVLDIKGEIFRWTARQRMQRFGFVRTIEPLNADASFRINPLDMVPRGPNGWDNAALIAEMLVVPTTGKGESDTYWEREARTLLTGLIQYVANNREGDERNLTEVWRILTGGDEGLQNTLDTMAELPDESGAPTARAMLQKAEREFASVVSTAKDAVSIFENPKIQKITSESDFDFSELRDATKCNTHYLIIPPEHLGTYKPFSRLMVGMLVTSLTATENETPGRPVCLMLDEFPALGYMPRITNGLTYLGGYGVRMWLFCQDIGQLERIYGEETRSILSNCKMRVFMTPNDPQTAELISVMSGMTTVPTWQADPRGEGWHVSTGETGRRLVNADEVMRLEKQHAYCFVSGLPVAEVGLRPYYDDEVLAPLALDWKELPPKSTPGDEDAKSEDTEDETSSTESSEEALSEPKSGKSETAPVPPRFED